MGEMTQTPVQDPGQLRAQGVAHGRRLKVFHLVDSLQIGGTETQAVELAVRMPADEYEITLGCLLAEGPLRERLQGSSVAVEEFHPRGGMDSLGGAYQLLRLAAFLRRGRFDVMHAHDLWSNLMGVLAARLAGVPAILSSQRDLSHLEWYQGSRRAWLRRIQNLAHVVLANATPIRDALLAEHVLTAEKLRVVHNGVDTARFERGQRDRERVFADSSPAKYVVLVGNMHTDVKGHPWLIAAAPAVVQEFPQTRFVFAGDGASRAMFEKQVVELGLQKNFLFLGRRQDIPDVLASSDIAVLPSKAEGLPNAVLEYMAAGLPTIATNVGGNAELVEDGVTGLLVLPQDPPALANALLRLLRDPAFASQVALKGRQMATREFSFERLVREIDALYTELLTKREALH